MKTRPNDESGVENDASDNTLDLGDSSDTSGNRRHAKKKTKVIKFANNTSNSTGTDGMQKKSKTKGSKKIVKETALNRDVDKKIKLL